MMVRKFRSSRAKSRDAGSRSVSRLRSLAEVYPERLPCRQSRGSTRTALVLGIVIAVSTPVLADSLMPAARYADEQLADPAKEKQAKALMETIRCLVCQGQSIADSNAEMAGDMRALIRTRIEAGEKPEAIRAWLIERYGDWVSFKPPLDGLTWPLYVVPVLFLGLGLWIVSGRLKRRRKG